MKAAALVILAASAVLAFNESPAKPQPSCAAGHYSVMGVPLRPAALNDRGQIIGTTAGHRAAIWSPRGGLREIPMPPGYPHSVGVALNEHGDAVGLAQDASFSATRAFLYAGGSFSWLEGEHTRAYAIDGSGVIAGEAVAPGATCSGAVLWERHAVREIAGCRGVARGLNGNGQVIGDDYDDQGRYHAFLWTASGGVRRIGPDARFSSAIAINAGGEVVIEEFPAVDLYSGGTWNRLALSPGFPSQPRAINACGAIVGAYGPNADAYRAFVWDRASGFRDLNGLLTSGRGAWKLESAAGIDSRGEIVGIGDDASREGVGFMLTPLR